MSSDLEKYKPAETMAKTGIIVVPGFMLTHFLASWLPLIGGMLGFMGWASLLVWSFFALAYFMLKS